MIAYTAGNVARSGDRARIRRSPALVRVCRSDSLRTVHIYLKLKLGSQNTYLYLYVNYFVFVCRSMKSLHYSEVGVGGEGRAPTEGLKDVTGRTTTHKDQQSREQLHVSTYHLPDLSEIFS